MRKVKGIRHPSFEQLIARQESSTGGSDIELHIRQCEECRSHADNIRLLLDRNSTPLGSRDPSSEMELGVTRLLGVLRDKSVIGAVSERIKTGRDLHLAAALEPYFGAFPMRMFENSLAGGRLFRPKAEELTETFLGNRAAERILLPPAEPGPPAPRAAIADLMSVFPWLMAGLQVALGASAIAHWALSGDQTSFLTFFTVHSPLVLSSLALFEYLAAMACWRQFKQGEPLRQAWLFLMAAAGCRFAGLVVTSFFGWFSGKGIPAPSEAAALAAAGADLNLTIVRPLCSVLLGLGLLSVIKLYRRTGLLRMPGRLDQALLAIVVLLVTTEITLQSGGIPWLEHAPTGGAHWLSSAALGLLLAEAVLLRRPVLQTGDGLVGRVWGAYVAAIFLTVAGDLAAWAVSSSVVAWQYSWVHTSVWLLAGLSYAMGPAYQMQALFGAKGAPPLWDVERDTPLPKSDQAYGIMSSR